MDADNTTLMRIPSRVSLKHSKCPDCREALGGPALDSTESVVRVVCKKDDCGYSVDLMWVGAMTVNSN